MTTTWQPLRPSPLGNGAARLPPSSSPLGKCSMPSSMSDHCPLRSSSSPSYRSVTSLTTQQRRPYRPSASSAQDRAEWHGRFLDRCAERLRVERAALVASRRQGLRSYADVDREGGEWTEEEEMLLRRKVLGEARRYRWAMERAGEEVAEVDDADALVSDLDSRDEPPELIDDDFLAAYAEAMVKQADKAPVTSTLLSSPCPACQTPSSLLSIDGAGVECQRCRWNVTEVALRAADEAFKPHADALHRPLPAYDPAIGSLCLCTGCDETLVLA